MNGPDRGPNGSDRLDREADEGRHPSPEELLALLEPGADPAGTSRVREHLTRCPRCFALHAEAARTVMDWKWGGASREVPAEWLEMARALPDSSAGGAENDAPRAAAIRAASSRVSRLPRFARRRVLVAAGLLAVLVPLGWVATRPPSRPWFEPVRSAVAEASRQGMVLSADIAPPGVPLRGVADRARVGAALDQLASAYERHRGSEEHAYWLAAAMLAAGDPSVGRVIEESLRLHPDSPRLANLEAVVLYRAGRVAEADQALTRILARWPGDRAALFNRAFLLRHEGRSAELESLRRAWERESVRPTLLAERWRREFSGPDR